MAEEMRQTMEEKKESRTKQFLDWAHHAYWIREFLGSIGLGGAIMTFLTKNSQVIAEYKWPIFLVITAVFMYVLAALRPLLTSKRAESKTTEMSTSPQASNALTRGIPHSPGSFDSTEFFRKAFYSSLQDISANSLRAEAERVRPRDKESFYLDLLTVGFMAMYYDSIWWPLFRSQLRALLALNKNTGIAPIGDFRPFYEEAAKEFEAEYKGISFDEWMSYLTRNTLVKIHPSEMVEITVQGKDFLKYVLHWGKSEETKRL